MDVYDLETALFVKMTDLTSGFLNFKTAKPNRVFNPETDAIGRPFRMGQMLLNDPAFGGFGNGRTDFISGIYQIDLYAPHNAADAFKNLKKASDEHVLQYWPANGKGVTVTKNGTEAHTKRRPAQKFIGLQGAYFREMIEIDFELDLLPTV